ncbi:hypothetical protein EVAR_18221_1 [Eumeta japonica]|uniref:Uncharacterized protein n=1 Tax=Eumeta variegata TaxID=151549 RepID=A0A4C1UL26_EUMVA|nr:hypothetical protein EVAR_18221_1 [Eumeta japonica]
MTRISEHLKFQFDKASTALLRKNNHRLHVSFARDRAAGVVATFDPVNRSRRRVPAPPRTTPTFKSLLRIACTSPV